MSCGECNAISLYFCIDLSVLGVACLIVFVNCLVKQFALFFGVVDNLLLNVMEVWSVGEVLCWIDRIWFFKECVFLCMLEVISSFKSLRAGSQVFALLNEDTVRVGDALLDEISEAQRSKWKEMIESTDFTHSSRKAWKTINKLTKDYIEPQQQCKVTVDQVAHQLLLNGKGNKLHVSRRVKMPRQTVTESKLTSPFLMETFCTVSKP